MVTRRVGFSSAWVSQETAQRVSFKRGVKANDGGPGKKAGDEVEGEKLRGQCRKSHWM